MDEKSKRFEIYIVELDNYMLDQKQEDSKDANQNRAQWVDDITTT